MECLKNNLEIKFANDRVKLEFHESSSLDTTQIDYIYTIIKLIISNLDLPKGTPDQEDSFCITGFTYEYNDNPRYNIELPSVIIRGSYLGISLSIKVFLNDLKREITLGWYDTSTKAKKTYNFKYDYHESEISVQSVGEEYFRLLSDCEHFSMVYQPQQISYSRRLKSGLVGQQKNYDLCLTIKSPDSLSEQCNLVRPNNEGALIEYLESLQLPIEISEVYSWLCRNFLEGSPSMYPEVIITGKLTSGKTSSPLHVIHLVNGELKRFGIPINGKAMTLSSNGTYEYRVFSNGKWWPTRKGKSTEIEDIDLLKLIGDVSKLALSLFPNCNNLISQHVDSASLINYSVPVSSIFTAEELDTRGQLAGQMSWFIPDNQNQYSTPPTKR